MWVGVDRIDMMDKTRTAVGRRVKAGGRQIIAGGVNHRLRNLSFDEPSGRHTLQPGKQPRSQETASADRTDRDEFSPAVLP